MSSMKRKPDEIPSREPYQKHLKKNGLVTADGDNVTCLHDVSYPDGYVAPPCPVKEGSQPAKVFPFPLDPFQNEAIKCLEDGESVMVTFLVTNFYHINNDWKKKKFWFILMYKMVLE